LQTGEGSLDRIVSGFGAWKAASCLGMTVKQASNLLRRLYRMGFLKRRKVKRLCAAASGKLCHRGFEYVYSFSKQGVSYLRWLREWKPLEDMWYAQLMSDVVSNLPEELRHRLSLLSLYRETFKYRGPSRNLRLFDNNAVPVISLCMANVRLGEEKRKLLIENTLLQHELDNAKRALDQSQGSVNMLYQYWAATLVEASRIKNEMDYWKAKAEEYSRTPVR